MKHTLTNRGFKHLEPIADTYGGEVRVYESSAAMQPCIWINVRQSETISGGSEAVSHLTLEQAKELREQLDWLIENHYQVEWELGEGPS